VRATPGRRGARASSLRRPVRWSADSAPAACRARHRVALAVPHAVDLVEDEELRRVHAGVLHVL